MARLGVTWAKIFPPEDVGWCDQLNYTVEHQPHRKWPVMTRQPPFLTKKEKKKRLSMFFLWFWMFLSLHAQMGVLSSSSWFPRSLNNTHDSELVSPVAPPVRCFDLLSSFSRTDEDWDFLHQRLFNFFVVLFFLNVLMLIFCCFGSRCVLNSERGQRCDWMWVYLKDEMTRVLLCLFLYYCRKWLLLVMEVWNRS